MTDNSVFDFFFFLNSIPGQTDKPIFLFLRLSTYPDLLLSNDSVVVVVF